MTAEAGLADRAGAAHSATARANRAPFEAVVARYGATVLRVARAVVGPVDADDVWSETFLAAMRAYPDLPAGANLEAWLVTIAHRKAIDVVRAASRRPIPTETLPETERAPRPARDDGLIEALAALPSKQKQAVAYHYLGGLPYAEVAAMLGGSEAAARRAAADGVAALRRTYPDAAPELARPAEPARPRKEQSRDRPL